MIAASTLIAELLGSFIWILVICTLAFRTSTDHMVQGGVVPLFIGLGLAVSIYICIGLGGSGHLNPLVTLSFAYNGKVPASDAFMLVVAQLLGGLAAYWLFRAMPNTLSPF